MQTLLLLLKHAETERDNALAACEQATRHERACLAQLQQLLDYRSDYEARWNGQFSRGGDISLVRCYHDFMARLTQAVDQQQRAADIAGAHKRAAEKTLQELELRLASVGKLLDRRHREVRINYERREQRQVDDMAARIVRLRPMGQDFVATR